MHTLYHAAECWQPNSANFLREEPAARLGILARLRRETRLRERLDPPETALLGRLAWTVQTLRFDLQPRRELHPEGEIGLGRRDQRWAGPKLERVGGCDALNVGR